MKYVVSWEVRPNVTEESAARSLQVFSKWAPSEAADYREFVGRVDGRGGFAVIETDDVALIAKDTGPFTSWFDFTVHPVLPVDQTATIAGEAVAFLASVG